MRTLLGRYYDFCFRGEETGSGKDSDPHPTQLVSGRARSWTKDFWFMTSLSLKNSLSHLQTHRKMGIWIHWAGSGPTETSREGEAGTGGKNLLWAPNRGTFVYRSLASSHKHLADLKSPALSFSKQGRPKEGHLNRLLMKHLPLCPACPSPRAALPSWKNSSSVGSLTRY